MDEDLIQVLSTLKTGRSLLVDSYTDYNADRYLYTFKYASSPPSLTIASDLLAHQWIDEQVNQIIGLFNEGNLSGRAKNLLFSKIQRFSIFQNSQGLNIEGYNEMLRTKRGCLAVMLSTSDKMGKDKHLLEFNYYRDKVLLEREMDRYLKELE